MTTFAWPHHARAAVCLSYDDALPCHPDLVAPMLEEFGFRGTFYAPALRDLFARTPLWKALAERGHELGNHTLFHPCRKEEQAGEPTSKSWNNLVHFTPDRFRNELRVANFILQQIDGRSERTYGNTCHHVEIGPPEFKQRIEPLLTDLFLAGRGAYLNQAVDPRTLDLMAMGTIGADGKTLGEWQQFVTDAMAMGGLALFTFHGVGPEQQRLTVPTEDHRRFLVWLRDLSEQVWVAPVIEVAKHIRKARGMA